MKRLAATAVLDGAVWLAYHQADRHQVFSDTTINRFVASEIVVTCVLAVTITVLWTRRWTPVALGLLQMFIGLGMLYFPIASDGTRLAIRADPTPVTVTVDDTGPATTVYREVVRTSTTPPFYTQGFRTFLMLASTYLCIMMILWAHQHRREVFPWFRRGHMTEAVHPGESFIG